MMWFLIAYNLAGQSVAVSTPYKGGYPPYGLRSEEDCQSMQKGMISRSEDDPIQKQYTFKCEQHKKFPKITGKVERDLYSVMKQKCFDYGQACVMMQDDYKHGLPAGTTVTRYWKAREQRRRMEQRQ